ncbi:unnamed protein product [Timema podura]|uniref:Uncharacterized protein n=1 Tax=Timema podura TaxID=61482 RepID=A0ABN7NPW3_TIMPD|nr:unnamed protein product [Timema podura]
MLPGQHISLCYSHTREWYTTSTIVAQSYLEHACTIPTNQYPYYRDCLANQFIVARVSTTRRFASSSSNHSNSNASRHFGKNSMFIKLYKLKKVSFPSNFRKLFSESNVTFLGTSPKRSISSLSKMALSGSASSDATVSTAAVWYSDITFVCTLRTDLGERFHRVLLPVWVIRLSTNYANGLGIGKFEFKGSEPAFAWKE